jgi:hypothetical protein
VAPSTAVCSVEPVGGNPIFTDGPYVETKEHLGGFAVVDVPDDEVAGIGRLHAMIGEHVDDGGEPATVLVVSSWSGARAYSGSSCPGARPAAAHQFYERLRRDTTPSRKLLFKAARA